MDTQDFSLERLTKLISFKHIADMYSVATDTSFNQTNSVHSMHVSTSPDISDHITISLKVNLIILQEHWYFL